MVAIDEQYMYLDLEEITNFIFKKPEVNEDSDDDAEPTEVETVLNQDGDPVQTVINAKNYDDRRIGLRYDLVSGMLDAFYGCGIQSEDGKIIYEQDPEELSIGAKLIMNTLTVHKFLKNKAE